jgi:hypothetical protein
VLVWIIITITVLVTVRVMYDLPGAVTVILGAILAAIQAGGAQVPDVASGSDVERLPGR